ncbi:MAG: thiopurine S-methyltransferase [Gammaproteobacteria bacterium]|nr:thiopurine S-methyltransferase [Gammaproteobacteria bacterium]
MHNEFWLERWQNKQTGFHQQQVNPYLVKYWPLLDNGANNRVFVPLCGKSADLVWLRQQGCEVVGVELSQLAVEAFFAEQEIEYETSTKGKLKLFKACNMTIFQGDFFDLSKDLLGPITAIFDRAALIALPETMRGAYCKHLASLATKAEMLLISMEYQQSAMQGPPFSVAESEIVQYYSAPDTIQLIDSADLLKISSQFSQQGLDRIDEKVFKISLTGTTK